MKRSVRIRLICLVLAAVVLSGALAASAIMGSPYETLKNAVLDALTERNATVEMEMSVIVNGEITQSGTTKQVIGDDSALISSSFGMASTNMETFSYSNAHFTIWPTPGFAAVPFEFHEEWHSVSVFPDGNNSFEGTFFFLTPEERNSSRMRFGELLFDLAVGDLRNNITMTSDNGIRRIRGSLTERQVPEIARVGLDMLLEWTNTSATSRGRSVSFDDNMIITEQISIDWALDETTITTSKTLGRFLTPDEVSGAVAITVEEGQFFGFRDVDGAVFMRTEWDTFAESISRPFIASDLEKIDPTGIPIERVTVNHLFFEAEVDSDGNLLYISGMGDFTATDIIGDTHEVEVNLTLRFSDIGTSSPVSPVSGIYEFLSSESIRFSGRASSVNLHFRVLKDGSIDADSLTTVHPSVVFHENLWDRLTFYFPKVAGVYLWY